MKTAEERSLPPFNVFPIALGCMGMSGMYGDADEGESVATIHQAIDSGINLIDTGDFYGMGHNELLVGRAIRGRRDQVLLSVKFGALRGPDGAWFGIDTRPAAVKTFLARTRCIRSRICRSNTRLSTVTTGCSTSAAAATSPIQPPLLTLAPRS